MDTPDVCLIEPQPPALAVLDNIIEAAQAAKAALADENEGEFKVAVYSASILASTLANEVAGW